MKGNEIPEKIYTNYMGYGVFDEPMTIRTKKSQIEYVRTDAIIEKACEWLSKHAKSIISTRMGTILGQMN